MPRGRQTKGDNSTVPKQPTTLQGAREEEGSSLARCLPPPQSQPCQQISPRQNGTPASLHCLPHHNLLPPPLTLEKMPPPPASLPCSALNYRPNGVVRKPPSKPPSRQVCLARQGAMAMQLVDLALAVHADAAVPAGAPAYQHLAGGCVPGQRRQRSARGAGHDGRHLQHAQRSTAAQRSAA
jgi:hypothetical protein